MSPEYITDEANAEDARKRQETIAARHETEIRDGFRDPITRLPRDCRRDQSFEI